MHGFSTGEVAELLGVHRDRIHAAIANGGPEASIRIGGKRIFSPLDVAALRRWFMARGKKVNLFDERDYQDTPAPKPARKPRHRGGALAGAAM